MKYANYAFKDTQYAFQKHKNKTYSLFCSAHLTAGHRSEHSAKRPFRRPAPAPPAGAPLRALGDALRARVEAFGFVFASAIRRAEQKIRCEEDDPHTGLKEHEVLVCDRMLCQLHKYSFRLETGRMDYQGSVRSSEVSDPETRR